MSYRIHFWYQISLNILIFGENDKTISKWLKNPWIGYKIYKTWILSWKCCICLKIIYDKTLWGVFSFFHHCRPYFLNFDKKTAKKSFLAKEALFWHEVGRDGYSPPPHLQTGRLFHLSSCTQQNSYSINHLLGAVTTQWLDSDGVVTVDNCQQHSYFTVNKLCSHHATGS